MDLPRCSPSPEQLRVLGRARAEGPRGAGTGSPSPAPVPCRLSPVSRELQQLSLFSVSHLQWFLVQEEQRLGRFLSREKPCAAAAAPALAALQPEMKFHFFPLSSSRQFWFHCNNGADVVPVPLWDKLAGSAPPNSYSPGPELGCSCWAGTVRVPVPAWAGSAFCRAHFSPTLLGLEMFLSFWHKPSTVSCLFQVCLTCGSSSEVSESLSCLCVGGWSCWCCVVNKLPLDL